MTDQDLTDLVQKMEFGGEASIWDDNIEFTDNTVANNPDVPAPRRNAPRQLRKLNNEISDEMSSELADSLADSMDAIDFVSDNFESGPQKLEEIKKQVTIHTVLPDFLCQEIKVRSFRRQLF